MLNNYFLSFAAGYSLTKIEHAGILSISFLLIFTLNYNKAIEIRVLSELGRSYAYIGNS